MQKIKKGDTVEVIAGKDLGQRGEVLTVLPKKEKVVIEGLNIAKRHRRAQQGPGGQTIPAQIVDFPAALHWSNVMIVCPSCSQRTRVGFRMEGERKVRYCKKCDGTVG
ncbi:MAG: 50S ribosomal protein L24 [Phototrophicaceae bacterium]|jgi:large subunit ribosomal protein L24